MSAPVRRDVSAPPHQGPVLLGPDRISDPFADDAVSVHGDPAWSGHGDFIFCEFTEQEMKQPRLDAHQGVAAPTHASLQ